MKNNKQMAYSRKKVNEATFNRFKFLFLSIAFIVMAVVLGLFLTGSMNFFEFFQFGWGSGTFASIVGFGTVDGNPSSEKLQGKQVKAVLYFIEAEQYDDSQTFPTGDRSIGNIPLKAGQYWNKVTVILDSPELKWKGTKGDFASNITNTAMFNLGGMEDDVFTLLEKGLGRGFYVVFEICSTGERWITGNSCKPAILTEFDGGADKDHTGTVVTFTCECGKIWQKYEGTTATLAAATVAANATTIGMTSNPQYQLTTGDAAAAALTAFTGVQDSDVGRYITILGSGGAHPSTIATGNMFVVKSTWTGDTNKQITFKVYKDTNSYKLIETSRI